MIPYYEELNDEYSGADEIVNGYISYAKEKGFNYVLVDTAGRLHIDSELMEELQRLNANFKFDEILLVIDSMMGQDAINVINEKLNRKGSITPAMEKDNKMLRAFPFLSFKACLMEYRYPAHTSTNKRSPP